MTDRPGWHLRKKLTREETLEFGIAVQDLRGNVAVAHKLLDESREWLPAFMVPQALEEMGVRQDEIEKVIR